jgi:DDE superfamily endonuclease
MLFVLKMPAPITINAIFDDNQEANLALQVCLLTYACWLFFPHPRGASFFEQRLSWERYCSKHTKRGTLKRRIRMEKDSFDKLLSYIYDELIVKEVMANNRGGPIIPELCLYCTLRFLAGGSYLDICDIAGISASSFYRVIWKTITALITCKELEIRFPRSSQDIRAAIDGFASISYGGAIKNCAAVCDGYLLRIKTPTKEDVGNVRSYFSGHYQCYGVNVQAASDHHSRFVFLAFASPGVTADRYAIRHCNLHGLIEELPFGICCIGDAAYEATEHMVPIYHGVDRLNPRCDNFNFYGSQLRIRIEMAFGLLQSKWGILQRPLQVKIHNAKDLIQATGRLHNFVINERLKRKEAGEEARDDNSPGYMPTIPHDENGEPIDTEAVFAGLAHKGTSQLREHMADRVASLGLERPVSNRLKRNLKRKHHSTI